MSGSNSIIISVYLNINVLLPKCKFYLHFLYAAICYLSHSKNTDFYNFCSNIMSSYDLIGTKGTLTLMPMTHD